MTTPKPKETSVFFMTNPNQAITSFSGRNAFLSNFYENPVTIDGVTFPTNENAFQAQKEPARAHDFVNITPGQSKRLGRKVNMRPDWDSVKDNVMYTLNKQKFSENETLKQLLLATGERELIEGNYWNDRYWGVCNGTGQNRLGKILMRIRSELRG